MSRKKQASVYDLVQQPRELDPRLSLASAAEYLDCSRDYLVSCIKSGELPAHKFKGPRGQWRVKLSDLDALCPPII